MADLFIGVSLLILIFGLAFRDRDKEKIDAEHDIL